MNRDSLQEKFQITTPPKNDESRDTRWDASLLQGPTVRNVGDSGLRHRNNLTAEGEVFGSAKFQALPPGMDIGNQLRFNQPQMRLSAAGETDVSADTNAESMMKGFTRRDMKATDDQYTGEHMDHFYGEAVDELGNVGFAERNNYLDRE